MRKSKFSESQIAEILKEAEGGLAVADLARKHGISAATFYQWRSRYGGMTVSDMQRLRELEQENGRLEPKPEVGRENGATQGFPHSAFQRGYNHGYRGSDG